MGKAAKLAFDIAVDLAASNLEGAEEWVGPGVTCDYIEYAYKKLKELIENEGIECEDCECE